MFLAIDIENLLQQNEFIELFKKRMQAMLCMMALVYMQS